MSDNQRTTGGQIGNTNAAKPFLFRDALHKALKRYENQDVKRGHALLHVCLKLVEKAVAGDNYCINMIGDRLDGKPAQAITGPSGEPITLVERVIVVQAIENQDPDPDNTIEMVPDHESMTYVRKLEEKQIVEEKPQ